jgi:pimeloyl-ACP methyl ester carboxylesterase
MSNESAGAAMRHAQEFFVGKRPHQMYVQLWTPRAEAPVKASPIVLIHGGVHTGLCWTTTPDGRSGWAPYLAGVGWPVYVVDWPGVGRSGFAPDYLTMGPTPIVDALLALLEEIGPAILIGHSIGAALSLKLADRMPERVRAIVALTPGPIGNVPFPIPLKAPDAPAYFGATEAQRFFISSERFPVEATEQYLSSLVPMSPSIENSLGDRGRADFRIDRPETVGRIPTLFLAADGDPLATNAVTEPMAKLLSVPHTLVGRDWGLTGFGHMLIIERGTLEIAARVSAWLENHDLDSRHE